MEIDIAYHIWSYTVYSGPKKHFDTFGHFKWILKNVGNQTLEHFSEYLLLQYIPQKK